MCSRTTCPSIHSIISRTKSRSRSYASLSLFSARRRPNLFSSVCLRSYILVVQYCSVCYALNFKCKLADGEHTRTKSVVTSKVGALSAFTTKHETCIGCRVVLKSPAGGTSLLPPYFQEDSFHYSLFPSLSHCRVHFSSDQFT